jgi:hypothetical protein
MIYCWIPVRPHTSHKQKAQDPYVPLQTGPACQHICRLSGAPDAEPGYTPAIIHSRHNSGRHIRQPCLAAKQRERRGGGGSLCSGRGDRAHGTTFRTRAEWSPGKFAHGASGARSLLDESLWSCIKLAVNCDSFAILSPESCPCRIICAHLAGCPSRCLLPPAVSLLELSMASTVHRNPVRCRSSMALCRGVTVP